MLAAMGLAHSVILSVAQQHDICSITGSLLGEGTFYILRTSNASGR